MKKRPWIVNLIYSVHDTWLLNKNSIVALFVHVIATIAVAFLGTLTTYYVALYLSNGSSASSFLLVVGILSIATLTMLVLDAWGAYRYQYNSTYARCTVSWNRMTMKAITTDYLNVEPKDNRKKIEEGFHALDSNWTGLESEMKQAPGLLIGLIGMLIYLVIAAIYVPWILLVMIPMVGFSILWSILSSKRLDKNREMTDRANNRLWTLSTDAKVLANAKDIRTYNLNNWFDKVLIFFNKELFKIQKSNRYFQGIGEISNNIFLLLRDVVAYLILINQYVKGSIDIATFTFLIGIVAAFSTWVNDFISAYNLARYNSFYVDNYRNALEVQDVMNHGRGYDISLLKKPFSLSFEHVSFSYPGSDKKVLDDINLMINPGEKIALVGNNGAGKTTLIKLLCGLYAPSEGTIRLNGIDIKEFNIDEYMSLISALFQDVVPLAFTIKDNITCAYGKTVDDEKLKRVIDEAGLQEKIASLKDHENTYITQEFSLSGIQLSGGETQKLLLARALYKNAPLLVLDEPTAALDPLAEEAMYKEYLKFTTGNTSIFISHRLASTRFSDRIIYLENGKIKEEGTHESLLRLNGKYREMFDLQAKYYREGQNYENEN